MSTPEIKKSDFVFESRRGRPKAENPYTSAIASSWLDRSVGAKLGVSMQVVLKNDTKITKQGKPANVVTAIGQLREAAASEGLGLRVETQSVIKVGRNSWAEPEDLSAATHTVIHFAAKERTGRKSKTNSDQ